MTIVGSYFVFIFPWNDVGSSFYLLI